MNQGYVVFSSATADLDQQADYLAENVNLDTALRFYKAAEKTFAFLVSTPEAGAIRDSRNPTLAAIRVWRIKGFENHQIFYRPSERGIEIVRVLHSRRDIDAELDDG